MRDRNGDIFIGTLEELRRHNDKLRKRESRQHKPDAISLPLPKGTRDALERVMARAGFDDARDFLAFQIHRLDALDSPQFEEQAIRTVTVSGLTKYEELIGRYVPTDEEDE